MTPSLPALISDQVGLALRYPVEALSAEASLDTLRFHENFHATEAMKADIAYMWHRHHLKEVQARLAARGEALECAPEFSK